MNSTSALPEIAVTPVQHYGGIRRLPFFAIQIGITILWNVIAVGIGTGSLTPYLLFVAMCAVPVYYRLKNIGSNPRWCALMIIPIVNIMLMMRCLAAQEGYHDTKKLDRACPVSPKFQEWNLRQINCVA